MQLNSETRGIVIYQESCGRITTHHMILLERSLHIYCLESIAEPNWSHPSFLQILVPTSVSDYSKELLLSLVSARKLASDAIQNAQCRYKKGYDRHA